MKNILNISVIGALLALALIMTMTMDDDDNDQAMEQDSNATLSELQALQAKEGDCGTDTECEGLDALAPDRCPECFNSKGDWQVKDCDDEKCNKKEEALFQKVFNSEV